MLASPLENVETIQSREAAAIAVAAPFDDLPEQVIASLAKAASFRAYAAGETIFAMGQFDGSEFLIVRSGRIKAAQADPKTGAMLFDETSAGEIYGLAGAVAGADPARLSGVSITAEHDCEIVAVDAEALRDVAAQRPSLTRNLMVYFARRLAGDARASAEEASPERRVYAALAAFVERDAVNADWRIARMPKHRELADRAGVEEADAASAVAKLIQSGVARRNYPGLIIDDMAKLNRLAR
jgi:CRP-like cAMP-binding protein